MAKPKLKVVSPMRIQITEEEKKKLQEIEAAANATKNSFADASLALIDAELRVRKLRDHLVDLSNGYTTYASIDIPKAHGIDENDRRWRFDAQTMELIRD